MVKKPKTVAKLKKEADKAWSEYIRGRDSDSNGMVICITCPTTLPWKQMQCGHFVSRRVSSLRFDEQNTNAQCVGCNMFHSGEQYKYGLALDEKYGDGTAAQLHSRRFETHSFTREELEGIIKYAKDFTSAKLSQ